MQTQSWQPPYPMPACHSGDGVRERQMAYALKQNLPRLERSEQHGRTLSIVGYGPSLLDTWQDIKHPIATTSGAHEFLISRGVVPDFHIGMDPRAHKLAFIMKPHADVTYIMASVCHPFTWGLLREHKVLMWHTLNGPETVQWVRQHDEGALIVRGGSAVGMGALQVGAVMGYRKFDVYGFDCSKRGSTRHAGPHGGAKKGHEDVYQWAGKQWWTTSKIMANTAAEFLWWLTDEYAGQFDVTLHGKGMLQSMLADARNPTREEPRRAPAPFVDWSMPPQFTFTKRRQVV